MFQTRRCMVFPASIQNLDIHRFCLHKAAMVQRIWYVILTTSKNLNQTFCPGRGETGSRELRRSGKLSPKGLTRSVRWCLLEVES